MDAVAARRAASRTGQRWPPPATAPTDTLAHASASDGAVDPAGYDPNVASNYVVSHLRTLVPIMWGAAVTWLIDRYVPAIPRGLATDPAAISAATSVATFGWYALFRWVEPHLPAWITALTLGHPSPPRYP